MTIRLHPDLMPSAERSAARAEAAAALRSAADLLETPHAWTQGCMARDARGKPIAPLDDKAVRWCLAGAINRNAESLGWAYTLAIRELTGIVGDPTRFNDRAARPAQVVAAARLAARKLEKEEA